MAPNPHRTRTPTGNIFQHGQLNVMGDGSGYRQTNMPDIARADGKPKNMAASPIKPGMKRQTQGALHPHLHGQMIDDETDVKLHLNGRSVNVHDGMGTHRATAHERGIVAHVEDGSRHLRAAGVLGRQDRVGEFDTSFVQKTVGKAASLPASKARRDR